MTSPAAGEEEEERLFHSPLRSFKMDCKSPVASKLQASIAAKLVEFLGNYSDDVLAEYIVVLVCNGKHQNQARTELQEFLGNESGKFVSWLWNYLSEEINLSNGALESSNSKAKLSTSHDDIIEDVHKAAIADIPLFKNGKCEPSTFSSKPLKSVEDPESLQRWCPTSDAVLLDVDSEITLKQTFASHRNSHALDYNYNSVKEYPSVGVRYSPDSSSVGEHHLHYDNQVQKIGRSNSSDVTCHPLTVAKAEPVPRSLRSVIAVSHQPKHISMVNAIREKQPSTAMDAVLRQNTRPRRNVWDRLGKPCNEDDGFTRQNQSQHKVDISDRTKLDHNGEGPHKLRPVQVVPDAILSRKNATYDSYGRVISNNHSDDHAIQDLNFRAVGTHGLADNSKRKRLFSEFSSGDSSGSSSGRKETLMQIKQAFPKLQESLPTTNNSSQNLQEFSSAAKIPTTLVSKPTRHPFKTSSRQPGLESNKVPQVQLNRRVSDNIPVQNLVPPSKTEPVLLKPNTVALEAKTNHKSMQDEATLVKSRLDQVQMDVLKLRYKQAEMHIEPKVSQNNPEEDIEPRTVLVTNVHFAASREAVLQHFTSCGHVLKVILLTDTITAQPKGAAYIVFSSKESAEKALKMSGTSLFCRQLTVMRKADMPSGFLVPSQLVGKIPQSLHPPPLKKGPVHRPYSSSNLQWRREQPASGESSVSAPANGSGSSGTLQ